MYYSKLLGYIPEHKQLEFEQTFRLATLQMPDGCAGYKILKDAADDCLYHFISYWPRLEALQSYTKSSAFIMMIDAFRILGRLRENSDGELKVDYSDN